ncbi:Spore coat protein [Bacillus mycoides]|nr:Spore coat protein [Bacillus mycoides]
MVDSYTFAAADSYAVVATDPCAVVAVDSYTLVATDSCAVVAVDSYALAVVDSYMLVAADSYALAAVDSQTTLQMVDNNFGFHNEARKDTYYIVNMYPHYIGTYFAVHMDLLADIH